jgi:hypothetical protein
VLSDGTADNRTHVLGVVVDTVPTVPPETETVATDVQ